MEILENKTVQNDRGTYEKSKNYDDGCFNCSAPKYRRVYRETERRYEARENESFFIYERPEGREGSYKERTTGLSKRTRTEGH